MSMLWCLTFCMLWQVPVEGQTGSFLKDQLEYSRVRQAFDHKQQKVESLLRDAGIDPNHFQLYLRGFKKEGLLEVWARSTGTQSYTRISEYAFCDNVGFSGPKRRIGDGQIPEGLYQIESFNPFSQYHLSLKINYPNSADRRREGNVELGGQIFIHGGCASIGCIPVTDSGIEEIYILAVLARDQGQKHIEVHLFPNDLERDCFLELAEETSDRELVKFWGNLRTCVLYFNQYKYPPEYSIDSSGSYLFRHPQQQ